MLNLNSETVRFIVDKAHEFQMLDQDPDYDSIEGCNAAQAELISTVDDLEPHQQISLVNLMWLGRGDYAVDEWGRALTDARASWDG